MSAEPKREVCPKCKQYAVDTHENDGLCYWCRKAAKREAIAASKEFEVHGCKIRPSFKSPTTGHNCDTIQGWVVVSGPCDQYDRWHSSKAAAVKSIEDLHKAWMLTGLYRESGYNADVRARCRQFWGDNPASLEADKRIVEYEAKRKAQHEAFKIREEKARKLQAAGPEMLEALKWARKVIEGNIPASAPEHTGRNQVLTAIDAVLAKAE